MPYAAPNCSSRHPLHLRSDVPIALSGDRFVGYRYRRRRAEGRSLIFSFVTDDPTIGEERFADLAAKSAGATARKVRIEPGELAADLDRLMAAQDEPFGSTSIYAQYRVFRLAAEHKIKVMLDGQGADEMLAGYLGYLPARLGSLIGRGRWLKAYALAGRAARRPGVGGRSMLLARGLRRLLPGAPGGWKALLGRPDIPRWMNAGWFAGAGRTGDGRSFDAARGSSANSLPNAGRNELTLLLR